jgi:hypothetical protein
MRLHSSWPIESLRASFEGARDCLVFRGKLLSSGGEWSDRRLDTTSSIIREIILPMLIITDIFIIVIDGRRRLICEAVSEYRNAILQAETYQV